VEAKKPEWQGLGGPLDDRQLVQKLLAGDEEAERLFFHSYRDKLYRTCVSFLGYQDPEAEDVTQEAFIVAMRKLPEFEFRSELFSWLYRICVNLCYERMDKRWRQVAFLQEDLEALARPMAEDRLQKEEENAVRDKRLKVLEEQKKLLGAPCQELLELRDVQGQSYADISQVLKAPMGTIMSRLARCRESLKQLVLRAMGK
jgi:RNA polymerase sigma-70 factor (ECF subfamily)